MTSWLRAASGCRSTALVFILIPVAGALAGCSANQSTIFNPPGSPANVNGNWQLTATGTTGDVTPMGVYLSSASGQVSGSAWVQKAFPLDCANGCCGGPFAEFDSTLAGTVDADGNLTLGSTVPGGGPVFTMTAAASGGSLGKGSYSLTGSCPEKGSVTGIEYPALNGTYAGTMTSLNTARSFTLSTTLNQSTVLNSRGFLDVSGTATLTGYPCINSATGALPLDTNSGFLGDSFGVTMSGTPAGTTLTISGTLSQDGKSVQATYVASGGNCSFDAGQGTLTLQ